VDPPAIDDVSGVVVKELMEETEDVLLLWDFEDMGTLGVPAGSAFKYADENRAQNGTVAV